MEGNVSLFPLFRLSEDIAKDSQKPIFDPATENVRALSTFREGSFDYCDSIGKLHRSCSSRSGAGYAVFVNLLRARRSKTSQANVVWSTDNRAHTNLLDIIYKSRLHLWLADFPTADRPDSSVLTFTFFWK